MRALLCFQRQSIRQSLSRQLLASQSYTMASSPSNLATTLGSISLDTDMAANIRPVTTTACFLGLPREVRIEIYRYILAPTYNVLLSPKRASINDQNPDRIYREILRTCSTCHEEGTLVLYSGHSDFQSRFLYTNDPDWLIGDWLAAIGLRNKSLVRNLGMSAKDHLDHLPLAIDACRAGCLPSLERLTCKSLLGRPGNTDLFKLADDTRTALKAVADLLESSARLSKFVRMETARPKLYFSFEDAGLSEKLLYLAICTDEGLKGLDGYVSGLFAPLKNVRLINLSKGCPT